MVQLRSMKRLPTLVAGGLAAALLLAGGSHGQSRHEAPRGGPVGHGYGGGERGGGPGYGYGGPRGYAPAPSRGYGEDYAPPRSRGDYGYGRPPPGYGEPRGYRPQNTPYRPSYSSYPPAGYRQNSLGADWREQQEEARAGVRQGQMAPLGRVIQGIGRRSAGRPLDAGIEYQGSRAVYRVRWMTAHGRRVDYIVDAATGAVLGEH